MAVRRSSGPDKVNKNLSACFSLRITTSLALLITMPTTGGVVDAFKSAFAVALHLLRNNSFPCHPDLIRHGKNHNARQQNDPGQYEYAPPQQQQQPQYQPQHHQQQAQHAQQSQPREVREQQQQAQTQKVTSPKYKEEVEQIVQEEREAKNKMPVYKGLENYKLLDKMGE